MSIPTYTAIRELEVVIMAKLYYSYTFRAPSKAGNLSAECVDFPYIVDIIRDYMNERSIEKKIMFPNSIEK